MKGNMSVAKESVTERPFGTCDNSKGPAGLLGRRTLAGALVFFSLAKLMSPYDPTFALPIEVYYGSAAAEMVMAITLLNRRFFRVAAGCSIVFFAAGLVMTWAIPGDCG